MEIMVVRDLGQLRMADMSLLSYCNINTIP